MLHTVLFTAQIWRGRIGKKIGYLNPKWESINMWDYCLFHEWLLSLGMVKLEQPEWTNDLERKEVCYTPSTFSAIVFDCVRLIWELRMLYVTFTIQINLVYVYTDYVHIIHCAASHGLRLCLLSTFCLMRFDWQLEILCRQTYIHLYRRAHTDTCE